MDALNGIIAGVFFQKQLDGEWHPIAYYLKIIIDVKLNYFIHDKKMLAIVFNF